MRALREPLHRLSSRHPFSDFPLTHTHPLCSSSYSKHSHDARFCDECKCHVCVKCNCTVFHLSYQEEFWKDTMEKESSQKKQAAESKKAKKKKKKAKDKSKKTKDTDTSKAPKQEQVWRGLDLMQFDAAWP